MPDLPPLLSLPDDQLLLALCVRGENLSDPTSWCQEMRSLWRAKAEPIPSADHANRLMQWTERLAMEASGERPQGLEDGFGLPIYQLAPEEAAFLSYELAVKKLTRS